MGLKVYLLEVPALKVSCHYDHSKDQNTMKKLLAILTALKFYPLSHMLRRVGLKFLPCDLLLFQPLKGCMWNYCTEVLLRKFLQVLDWL